MLRRLKHHSVKTILAGLLVSLPVHADSLVSVGNGVIRPQALEQVIRESIADALGGRTSNNSMSFMIPTINENVIIPETTGTLKSILDVLGLKDQFAIKLAPTTASFTLPSSSMKITVQNRSANTFAVSAKFSLTALSAKSSVLTMNVPAGVFGQAFDINSSPIQMGLKSGSAPIQMEIDLLATLASTGAKLKLQGFHTNLDDTNHPEFSITLGRLTVNNSPLTLTLNSNGQSINADEPTIRAELQKLESSYVDIIRADIVAALQTEAASLGKTIADQAPLKYDFTSDQFLADAPLASEPGVKNLLSGIDLSGVLSYVQQVQSANVYSMQVSSSICMDGQCLNNTVPVSPIGADDLKAMTANEDMSVILYESFFQSVVNSPVFQKRIATYAKSTITTPGVTLAPSGVKVYLDPATNAVIAILNLEIDIKKTSTSSTPFGQRLQNDLGDLLETEFGSGKVVKIPIAINLGLGGIVNDSSGNNLVVHTSLPSFATAGVFTPSPLCSASACPNNVPSMTSLVRGSFLTSLKQQVSQMFPSEIKVPLSAITLKTFTFTAKNVLITTHHGLMITAGLTSATGVRP